MGSLLSVDEWVTPVSVIPEQSVGKFHIKKRIIKAGMVLTVDAMSIEEVLFNKNCTLTILREGIKEDNDTESVWMSDTPMEFYKAWELVARAKGPKILVGGLGLGLVTHLLTLRNDISEITVVELQEEVIQMVSPSLNGKVKIVHGDFLVEITRQENCYNTVIADLWKTGHTDKDTKLYKDCKYIINDYQPNAIKLFWAFQETYDTEIAKPFLFSHSDKGTLDLPSMD